jgi:hypothetical protein
MFKRIGVLGLAVGALTLSLPRTKAEILVNPQALTHYAHCVSEAKDRNGVFLLDRGVMYRCGSDTAISYFNFLQRIRSPEYTDSNFAGLFVYRLISGVGTCWHKIEDPFGNPVSIFGCDIYVEY